MVQNHTISQMEQNNRITSLFAVANSQFDAVHAVGASQRNILLPTPPVSRETLHSQGTAPEHYTGMTGGLPLPQ